MLARLMVCLLKAAGHKANLISISPVYKIRLDADSTSFCEGSFQTCLQYSCQNNDFDEISLKIMKFNDISSTTRFPAIPVMGEIPPKRRLAAAYSDPVSRSRNGCPPCSCI
jgi:hypothetical protein